MQKSSTNLRNRVTKLHLPKTKPLLPLFEIISNSIHAIREKKEKGETNLKGLIHITIIRNGDEKVLSNLPNIENYPIHSFKIRDNGIGLDKQNYNSFKEFDSEYKSEIGGKGIGRLVCLKAFQKLIMESAYFEDGKMRYRNFEYKKTKEGFDNYNEIKATNFKTSGTIATLYKFEDDFQKQVPLSITEISRQIVSHFQIYFIQGKEPEIIIRNQNNDEINLTNLFSTEFEKEILEGDFSVFEIPFKLYISSSFKAKSHKIHYCGHERSVKEEGLSKYIVDLKNAIKASKENEAYYFQVFIVSDFLSSNVNEERTGFNFILEDDIEEFDVDEISLAKIRNKALYCIEEILKDFLSQTRKEKLAGYLPIIQNDFPNYHAVVNYNKELVEKLPVGLSKNELDIKLYEIESQWRIKVKLHGIDILKKKKDITSLDQYKEIYEKFVSEFNEIGQSDLARYIIHRRSVIDLLDRLIELNNQEKFSDEEIIHSLFFPIRETNLTVTADKQNLWLLDERLTFNTLLSSDKLFKQIDDLSSTSSDRMDLVIRKNEVYENATLFSENKFPFESFTIVEFKKPGRNDYLYGDPKKDPIFQIRKYIREIIDGKIKRKGRTIEAKSNTPFYCYVIADITPTLQYILKEENFTHTPDGLGSFRFYETTDYKSYIEVLPFNKVINDAKQRNKILFDKLNLTF